MIRYRPVPRDQMRREIAWLGPARPEIYHKAGKPVPRLDKAYWDNKWNTVYQQPARASGSDIRIGAIKLIFLRFSLPSRCIRRYNRAPFRSV